MKQYKMPLILGCIAWILAGLSVVIGIIDLVQKGLNKNTYFAAIICIGGVLSGVNLLRLHRQLKNRKPPNSEETNPADAQSGIDVAETNQDQHLN